MGENLAMATAYPICLTVVFMGDSITFGQYVSSSLRWSDLIADKVNVCYLDTPINFMFANRGVSGETTRQGLERYPSDVQALCPDIMTLQFGLNDCNCWVTDRGLPRVSMAGYRANLVEMIVRARYFSVKHLILLTSHQTLRHKILPSGESLETQRIHYNQIVRDVAQETGVTLCDIEAEFLKYSHKELASLLLPYPDVLHLSPLGHEVYANVVGPFINRAIADIAKSSEHRHDQV